ncbi:bifunctional DNA primase/polymerase [Tardiphaga sp. OK246]|uniref:bifunctional DNA primase/polymerase n=1 Tax=Tardiphaga sp. OK246 TaxID=1855307 RepID=UPI0015953154|nr:bifunctional DNA primase/polymerase [Tardiphaga sp. OK246]
MSPFEAALRKLPLDQYTLIPLHRPFDTKTKNGVTRSIGKAPIDKNWTKATYDNEKVIERCVREKRNIGVRLRKTQIVIDIDPRNGGDVAYATLFAEYGIDESIFPRVVTGSGGLHLYCLNSTGAAVLDSLGEEYQGVEFKSKGRQVVAPGSIHPDTMKPYVWDRNYPPIEDAPEIPTRLLKLIRKPKVTSQTRGGGEYDQQQIAAMLDHLDARQFSEQKRWLNIMMASHHASKGDARSEFIEWSITDPQYKNDAAIIGRRWDSLHRSKLNGIKAGTLEMYMREAGATNAIPYKGVKAIPNDEWADGDASLAEHIESGDEFEVDAAIEGDFEDDGEFDAAKPMKYDMVELEAMLDYAEEAMLCGGAPLYQTAKRLVHPVRMERASGDDDSIRRAAGALTIQDVTALRLNQYMIEHAKFFLVKKAPNGAAAVKKKHAAPLRLAEHMIARPDKWKIPALTGIIETPTLRREGSLLADEGYDDASGLLLDMGGVTFPAIPDKPSRDEALSALKLLKRPLAGFPFVADGPKGKSASRSVMLSAMLTALVRRSLPSAPMHGFSAPTPGTGKTLAVQVAAVIATGHEVTAMSQGANSEEDEKRIFSVLMQGDQVVLIDNVTRPIGGNALCTILTEQFWQSRMLGFSRNATVATNVLMTASGNNLVFEGDMTRRALLCRMDAGIENPEGRSFDMDLKQWVPANRVKLVAAGLTVLRAFVAAGRPGLDKLSPFGSFEDWSRLVRGAICWLNEPDPCLTRSHIAAEDPVKAELTELLAAIQAVKGSEWFSAGELLAITETDDAPGASIMEVIDSAIPRVNKKSLGLYLKNHERQIVGGLRLETSKDTTRKINLYRVAAP